MMIKLVGFHGTDKQSAKNICQNGIVIEKNKNWFNDLGIGFYCYVDADDEPFEPAIVNAKRYAETFKSRKGTPEVLKIDAAVLESRLLNLTNGDTQRAFQMLLERITEVTFETYRDRLKAKSGAAKRNNRDGFKIEYVIANKLIREPSAIVMDTHTDFEHIRSNFDNGRELVLRDASVVEEIRIC